MPQILDDTLRILDRLVSFDSLSGRPTHAIVGYIRDYLADHGIEATLSYDAAGERANIFATIGPEIDGGVVLNGHTDVVPVTGQNWSSDPFTLTRRGERLYGRGAVDMKGFLACVLASAPRFRVAPLNRPVHIAFSYDEEIGGYGMPVLLESMATKAYRPDIVVVGEPTEMTLVTGHKGGCEMRTEITGRAVHSCDPGKGVNAISVAAKLIAKIEAMGAQRAANPVAGSPYDPPFSTFNIGTIEGGVARNATAGWCRFDWEHRPLPGEDGAAAIREIENYAATHLLPAMKAVDAGADIRIVTETFVPPLDDRHAERAAAFVGALTGITRRNVVSFGTDAGYFSEAGFSTVVCGPGDISRAHRPDEYIETGELTQGLDFLDAMARHLSR